MLSINLSFFIFFALITCINSIKLNASAELSNLETNFQNTHRKSSLLSLNAIKPSDTSTEKSTNQVTKDLSAKQNSNENESIRGKIVKDKQVLTKSSIERDVQDVRLNGSNSISLDDANEKFAIDAIDKKLIYRNDLRNVSINLVENDANRTTHENQTENANSFYNDAVNRTNLNQTNESLSNENLLLNSTAGALSANSTLQVFKSLNTSVDDQTTSQPIESDSKASNGGSVVEHLLSNDDIKEYQKKRKEEDEIRIVHLKEAQTKPSKSKFEAILPILRKSKANDDVENNDINHLQEIDIAEDVKSDVKETHKPQLIVISLDAMRYDYVKMFRNNMDNFQRMAKIGVSAPFGIQATFLTQTIASHYSIATGLYEESTGIIDNRFYDPKLNQTFKSYAMKGIFFTGEPIWNTAVKQNLESRIYFWPGSEVAINGLKPTESMKFNLTVPFKDQIEKAIEWIENGTDLCMIYCGQPDFAGHNFGIGSKEMALAIKEINFELGILIDYVKQKNINLIVTADHGMVQVDKDKLIVLEDYLDFRKEIVRIPQFGSIVAIQPKEGKLEQVMNKLSKVPYMKCYRKNDIPEHYHYKNNYRIQPIICIPELASYIIRTRDDPTPSFGIHGYDPRHLKMRPIFYAIGPDFKQNYVTHPFEQVNLYSLFAHLLHIQEAPNNGSIHNIKHILSDTSLSRLI